MLRFDSYHAIGTLFRMTGRQKHTNLRRTPTISGNYLLWGQFAVKPQSEHHPDLGIAVKRRRSVILELL